MEGEVLTQEASQQSDEPAQKKKMVILTDEQEEDMAEWLKGNSFLYNKGKYEYRDVDKKDTLCAVQAGVMHGNIW